MKRISLSLFSLFLFTGSLSLASPLHPFERYECTQLKQDDGKGIGAICPSYDTELQVKRIDVYYWGYLFENPNDYSYTYANLSIEGFSFRRRGMKKQTYGDGHNLPKREVMYATYVATSHFENKGDFPAGKRFEVYFQGEEIKPKHNPPFSYDSNLERNYRGEIKRN